MDLRLSLLFIFVSIVVGFNHRRRCLLFNNKCVSHCPRNMHPYHTRCDRYTISQRTCAKPRIEKIGYTCGWSRCDCNGDMVLDEEINVCVDFASCSRKLPKSRKNKPPGTKRRSKSKKIRIEEEEELAELM